MTSRPVWVPGLAAGLIVLAFGLWEVLDRQRSYFGIGGFDLASFAAGALIVAFFAVAVGLHRIAPGYALTLVWVACVVQLLTGTDVLYTQLSAVVVAFGCARWGSTAIVWLSGLSIPVGALIAVAWVLNRGADFVFFNEVFRASQATGIDVTRGTVAVLAFLVLALPWLAGIVFRVREQARRSREHELEAVASQQQAEEIAAIRAEQTRLAHDVHDVVGHSLAVILAQAESAQFLPDDDAGRMKETMANIAVSARQSLRDVRHVLSPGDAVAGKSSDLDELIDGVRSAGNDVASTVVGVPRPLPPEIASVAYRTLQEMLTNAIKHGVRGTQVIVIRHWGDELTLMVKNPSEEATAGEGLGLGGMRHRLESIGGRLDLGHDDDWFVATAWLPLRHGMLSP